MYVREIGVENVYQYQTYFFCIDVLSMMQRKLDVSDIVLEDPYQYQTNVFVYIIYEWL